MSNSVRLDPTRTRAEGWPIGTEMNCFSHHRLENAHSNIQKKKSCICLISVHTSATFSVCVCLCVFVCVLSACVRACVARRPMRVSLEGLLLSTPISNYNLLLFLIIITVAPLALYNQTKNVLLLFILPRRLRRRLLLITPPST